MATELTRQKPTQLQARSGTSYTAEQEQILKALAAAVIFRGASADESYLDPMTRRLSKERIDLVLDALKRIGEAEREEGEPALPSLGRILRGIGAVAERERPDAYLRSLVRKMASNWNAEPDLEMWTEICGHRTDADMDTAFRTLMRDDSIRRMPSPAMFLQACGVMKERRDGNPVE